MHNLRDECLRSGFAYGLIRRAWSVQGMIPFHEVLLRLFGALIGVERDLRTVIFALTVLGWVTEKLSLKRRSMFSRFTRPLAQNVAVEIHSLLANMKISMRQFRVSGTGNNSVVEFEADVSNHQEEQIIVQLSPEGVVTEVVPCEARL